MKLNLGCGSNPINGYLNIDIIKAKGVDKVLDLNKFPYPFKDNSIDEVYASHILEHLEHPIDSLKEILRILKPSHKLKVIVPHFCSSSSYTPFHRTYWNTKTFVYFKKSTHETYKCTFPFPVFSEVKIKVSFLKGKLLHNYIVEKIVNLNQFTMFTLWESTILRILFPSHQIEVELIK